MELQLPLKAMPPVAPPDLPSLLPLGFHHLTMGNVEQVCVDLFPLSTIRATIFGGLVTFVQTLEAANVPGELWIDGSFLTDKINPKDVDVLLRVDGAVYNSGTQEQRDAIDWVIANQKLTLLIGRHFRSQHRARNPDFMRVAELRVSSKIVTTQ